MIDLRDAIERAKLAADESGLISSYTFDRLVEQLDFSDRHSFTMALVDLGIVTKHASLDDEDHMAFVLSTGEDFTQEDLDNNRKISIVEEFVRVAHQFIPYQEYDYSSHKEARPSFPKKKPNEDYWSSWNEQTPIEDAGTSISDNPQSEDYWSSWNEGASPSTVGESPEVQDMPSGLPQDQEGMFSGEEDLIDYAPFTYSDTVDQEGQDDQNSEVDSTFFEKYDTDHIQSVLENNGVHVNSEGMVSLYSQNIPGLFNQKVPLKPMTLDSAISLFSKKVDSARNQLERISTVQDVLSSLKSDFSEIDGSLTDLVSKFNDSVEELGFLNYPGKTNDPVIQEISSGVEFVKGYLDKVLPHMEEVWSELRQQTDTIKSLQSNLDQYSQTYYEGVDKGVELHDALQRLKEVEGTAMFDEVVTGIGGVSAALRKAMSNIRG